MKTKVICLNCKKEFLTYPSEVRTGKARFCSKDCAFPPYFKYCLRCNKRFRISPSRIKLGKNYCSKLCTNESQLGSPGYWLGKKRIDLMNTNASKTMFKPGLQPWNKGIKWLEMRGDKHPKWVGDKIKHKDKRIRMSIEYKEWRKLVYQRDNYTCQICFVRGGELQADHIKPFSLYPELRYELSNGRTLCIECHKKTPTYGRSSIYLNRYEKGGGAL